MVISLPSAWLGSGKIVSLEGSCITLRGLPSQRTTTVWLKQQKFIVSVVEARSPRSSVGRVVRKSVPCSSSSFGSFAGNLGHSLACGSIILIPAFIFILILPLCMFMSKFPLLLRMLAMLDYESTLLQCNFILTNYIYKVLFPNKVTL